jgi:hypothetical protein
MAEILATKTSRPGDQGPGTFEAARAGALFASTLQPSGSHSPGQIRRAVAATLQRLGVRGCAAQVAGGGPGSGLAATRLRELTVGRAEFRPRPERPGSRD